MSTSYVTDKPIDMATLRNFHHQGVWVDSTEEDALILTDGTYFLHAKTCAEIYTVRMDHAGHKAEMDYSHEYHEMLFIRYGCNDPEKIILAIEDFFQVKLISENEDAFNELVE